MRASLRTRRPASAARLSGRAGLLPATVLTAASLALAACSGGGSHGSHASATSGQGTPRLTVSSAFLPQPVGDLAAGFLVVKNTGTGADKLLSVTSPVSDEVSIHRTVDNRMVDAKSFPIPAGGELDLERGGNHVMFMDVKQQLKKGQRVQVELHFQKSPPIKVTVPVEATNFDPGQS
jgi:copper(I)-binding protein